MKFYNVLTIFLFLCFAYLRKLMASQISLISINRLLQRTTFLLRVSIINIMFPLRLKDFSKGTGISIKNLASMLVNIVRGLAMV